MCREGIVVLTPDRLPPVTICEFPNVRPSVLSLVSQKTNKVFIFFRRVVFKDVPVGMDHLFSHFDEYLDTLKPEAMSKEPTFPQGSVLKEIEYLGVNKSCSFTLCHRVEGNIINSPGVVGCL